MQTIRLSRRAFLRAGGSAGAVLVLGLRAATADALTGGPAFSPDVFVSIDTAGLVRITVSKGEMGQGVRTALPRILADELDADLARVDVAQAPGDPRYGDQNTDGSRSIRMLWSPLRRAGAVAREMLVRAAAETWGMPVAECRAREHGVEHPLSGRRLDYAQLVVRAARLPVPAEPALKDPAAFRYIGVSAPLRDARAIVTGGATYGFDVRIPGMKYACVARAPVFDARIRAVDDAAARAVRGVIGTYRIPFSAHPRGFRPEEGIAVLAESSWSAMRGRDALAIEWNEGANAAYQSAGFRAELLASVREPGKLRLQRGDIDAALAAEGERVEADYETAMLAHAPMEPPVAVAWVHDGVCEIWAPVQDPQDVRRRVAEWLGMKPERVSVHVTFLGGAFGRKSQVDFVFEAVEVSTRAGVAVKLFWTREDDIRNCYFHAESAHRMEARLGADGMPAAWRLRTAYPSIDWMEVKGLDHPMPWETGMGLTNMPFAVPALSVEACRARVPIRIGWLRSVCNLWHAFALNGFIDEMATAAGKDPVAYRLAMLGEDRVFAAPNEDADPLVNFNGTTVDTARYRGVIEFLAERTGWGLPAKPGIFRGFAAHNSFYSYAATVVEVEYDGNRPPRVVRIDTAIDCGRVVNPEGVRKQIEGAAIFALGVALFSEITVRDGRAQQANFGDYRVLRLADCPRMIEAHIVPSGADPGGAGEPPTSTVAPALAAALFAATGTRHRRMPMQV